VQKLFVIPIDLWVLDALGYEFNLNQNHVRSREGNVRDCGVEWCSRYS